MEINKSNGHSCELAPEPISKSDIIEPSSLAPEKVFPDNSQNFTINFYKNYKISICKPLILLKLTLFMHYGAGSFIVSFITILYKQRGVSLSEMSTMTMSAPVFQFLGSAVSGVIADKIGKAKPVFVFHVLLISTALFAITMLPNINVVTKKVQDIDIMCHQNATEEIMVVASCKTVASSMEVQSCRGYCQNEFASQCVSENIDCWNYNSSVKVNASLILQVNNTFFENIYDSCLYTTMHSAFGNKSQSLCSENQKQYCTTACTVLSTETTNADRGLLMTYGCLYVLFLVVFSTSYRCLDVTVMHLVNEYNSSFGHERFFAMLGNVLLSPLAGFVADATTPPGGERNYSSTLYLYIALCAIMLPILYNLPMVVKPPGENMWRKSTILLKNPDVISFFIAISFLGCSWNLGKYFLVWYLESINASSILIGLLASVSALYGLPFLLTSHWWVKKIGATRIFILALVTHSISFTLYSFIQNPWISLALESNGILTYYLLWVAAVEYSHEIAPEGLTATIIAIAGAVHYSIGKISAGLIGRFIMKPYGGRIAFRFCAVMTLSVAFLYTLFLYFKNKYSQAEHKFHHKETNSNGTKIAPTEIDLQFVPPVTEISECHTNLSFTGDIDKK